MTQSCEWVIGDEDYLQVMMSQDLAGLFLVQASRNTAVDSGYLKGTHDDIIFICGPCTYVLILSTLFTIVIPNTEGGFNNNRLARNIAYNSVCLMMSFINPTIELIKMTP